MLFIFNLAFREIRSSWRRLLFFFICIGIGVGSIVALRSLIQNLNVAVTADARFFLTADVEVSSTSPWQPSELQLIEQVAQNFPNVESRNETILTSTTGLPHELSNQSSTMIELKGVENGFPLVGSFTLSDGKAFDTSLLDNKGIIVSNLLLEKLNVKIGDEIDIGSKVFQIRGVFDKEPGGVNGFRLGPRVFVKRSYFESSGLTNFGARARRNILFKVKDSPEEFVTKLREALKSSTVTVRSYKETQEGLGEQFDRSENFLALTGLLLLVLGGIGVWNVARVFVEQKRKTIAVLKCVGGTGNRIISAYLLQIVTLGFVGSLFGVGLAKLALFATGERFSASLPETMSYNLSNSAIWQGVFLGVVISLLFSALPLWRIRKIKPVLLLRDSTNEQIRRFEWKTFTLGAIVLIGLLGLSVWQAGSFQIGAFFLVGLAITAGILYLAATGLTKILRQTKSIGSFPIRQAVNSLYRPGNQTRVILLAVGLGVFVILGVQLMQANLLREFDLSRGGKFPSLFLIDIQKSQAEAVKSLIERETAEPADLVPIVRARISAINGKKPDFDQKEIRQQQGQIGREYALTYRPQLEGNEEVVDGKWWDATPATEPEVSIEEGVRGLMGLDLGGYITFDILGRKITAKVTSVRQFNFKQTRTTFLFVFRPGTLENAPTSFVCPVTKSLENDDRLRLQSKILREFPNLSVIDSTEIIKVVSKLLSNLTLAISFVGLFVVLSGVLILIGSIALTKFQRIYENAILKTLGAKRLTLLTILLAEYGLLGILAGIIGGIAAIGLSFAVTKYVLKLEWHLDWTILLIGIGSTILVVMLVGAISSFDVLFRKPLQTLRLQ